MLRVVLCRVHDGRHYKKLIPVVAHHLAKTRAKKDALLMVLKHPEIPLHNNPAELEARRRVRKGDVSFRPRTEDGKKA